MDTGQTDTSVDAGAEFASVLIEQMEMKLSAHDQLDDYDVYCEWYDDEPNSVELWLRDRADDSRIGPLDYKAMMAH